MPDERQDSIRQGIHAPEESPIGRAAAEARRQRAAEGPPIGGAMGGSTDSDSPAEEAQARAAREAPGQSAGGDGTDASRTLRDTR
jgi:hypothetical protein